MTRPSDRAPPLPLLPPTIPLSSPAAALVPHPARTARCSALLSPLLRPMATYTAPGRIMTPFTSRKRFRQTSTRPPICPCCSDWLWCVPNRSPGLGAMPARMCSLSAKSSSQGHVPYHLYLEHITISCHCCCTSLSLFYYMFSPECTQSRCASFISAVEGASQQLGAAVWPPWVPGACRTRHHLEEARTRALGDQSLSGPHERLR